MPAFSPKVSASYGVITVETASQIRIAIINILKAKRLKLCFNSIYDRKGGSAIFGGLLYLSQRHKEKGVKLVI